MLLPPRCEWGRSKVGPNDQRACPGALIEAANIVGDLVQAKPRVAAE